MNGSLRGTKLTLDIRVRTLLKVFLLGLSACQGNEALDQSACDSGDMISCYDLGVMYQGGQGVPQDLERAVILFQRSCDGGVGASCNNLGFMYELGAGVPLDFERAISLYQEVCDDRAVEGCYNLGFI